MADICVIKLGGSIITDKKNGRPLFRARRVKEIANEIAKVRSKMPNIRLVILYGGGSFGHPLAHRFKLLDQILSKSTFTGIGYTLAAMRELGTRLSISLLDVGLPVVPLQTSSFAGMQYGRLRFTDLSILETILECGGIPLLGGDVVFSDRTRSMIASADMLAVELARKLSRVRLFFATDTDGVYASFPPRLGQRPLATIDRQEIRALLKTQRPKTGRTDVTGAMPGKLHALLPLRDTTVMIFSGNTRGVIADVLSGKKRGTCVTL